jgi:hypothetical protein
MVARAGSGQRAIRAAALAPQIRGSPFLPVYHVHVLSPASVYVIVVLSSLKSWPATTIPWLIRALELGRTAPSGLRTMPFLAWLVDGPSRTRIGYNPAAANMIRSYLSSLYYDMKLFFGEILICLLMITSLAVVG